MDISPKNSSAGVYWLLFALIFVGLVIVMQRNLDFADQSLYLLYVQKPQDALITANFYYFYLAPIYDLLGGQIYAFRLFGFFALILACLPLGALAKRHLFEGTPAQGFWPVYLLAVLSYYKSFIVDPGYNHINIIALMLFAAAMLIIIYEAGQRSKCLLAGGLIGLSGWMSFSAKPTSAAMLALIFLCTLAFAAARRRLSRAHALSIIAMASAILAFLALLHFTLFDTWEAFIIRVTHALQLFSVLESGHSLYDQLRIAYYDIVHLALVVFQPSFIFWPVFLVLSLSARGKQWLQHYPHRCLLALLSTLPVGFYLTQFFAAYVIAVGGIGVMLLFFLFHSAVAILRIYFADKITFNNRDALLAAIVLLFTSYAYRLGSNLSYIFMLNFMGAIAFCILLFTSRAFLKYDHFNALCSNAVFPGLALLFTVIWYQPYYTAKRSATPIHQHTIATQITDNPDNILYLDETTHRYVTDARHAFKQHNFKADTLIIDMTGYTPFITYLADARPTPSPWLPGGFRGSAEATLYNFSLIEQTVLQNAWILTKGKDCESTTAIDTALLNQVGLSFPDTYEAVQPLMAPWPADACQMLWKPK